MDSYRTIQELVIERCVAEGQFPAYESLTSLVREHFPASKWQKTHYAWYKSRIKAGEIPVPGISGEASDGADDDELGEVNVEESAEASLSLERDLHSHFAGNVHEIETGLKLVVDGVEYQSKAGRIDLLAKDASDQLVVIELKVGRARDNALGQLLGYMGCLSTSEPRPAKAVRGILVARDFDDRVIYGARVNPSVKLVKYRLSFDLQVVT